MVKLSIALEGNCEIVTSQNSIKKSTRKRKAVATPEFRKKLRIFEEEEEEEMGGEGELRDGELSEAQGKLPVTKQDQKNMVDDLKKFITESQAAAAQKFEETVKDLKAEIGKQNETIAEVKNDVGKINDRLEKLEKREMETEEMIESKIKERTKKMERKSRLRERVLAEIMEEECKILVTGYKTDNKPEDEIIRGIISEIMKEGAQPRTTPVLEWSRKETVEKKSLVMMNTGSQENRDHIMLNLKANKNLVVSKTFPKRYQAAKAKMNQMGAALRKLYPVNTDLFYEGTTLGLWYRDKKTPGVERGEWTKHFEVDPITEEIVPDVTRKIGGKSLLIMFSEKEETPQVLEETTMALLGDYSKKAKYKAISCDQMGLFFEVDVEAKAAEASLRNELGSDVKIIRV